MVYKRLVRDGKNYHLEFFQLRGEMEVLLQVDVYDRKKEAQSAFNKTVKWKNEEVFDASKVGNVEQ